MIKSFFILSTFLIFSACNTGGKPAFQNSGANQYNKLSEGADQVKIAKVAPKNCKEVGDVVAGGNLGEKQRRTYMKNKAIKVGGNYVQVTEKNLLRTTGVIFKCN